jgi:heme/copper-type cytochrome/quinol oxidase subunit 2
MSRLFALVVLVVLGVLAACLYFLPTIVAHERRAQNTVAIFLFNLLFGWGGIPWLILIVWAFVAPRKVAR